MLLVLWVALERVMRRVLLLLLLRLLLLRGIGELKWSQTRKLPRKAR